MIVTDVNVMVFAYRREADRHAQYADWLNQVVAGGHELGLVDVVFTGFLRIVTNPRIVSQPAPTMEALHFVERLRGARRGRKLTGTDSTWAAFASIVAADRAVRGNLVPDAWLAALARSHGARLATADRGFARFEGVRCFDPARV